MNTLLFLIVFSALTLFYAILGFFASKKITSTSDYFLAGRDLGLLPVTFTLIATQLGGGMMLGTSQEAYSIGLFGILYTMGMIIGFMLLSFGLAAKLQRMQVATTAELFQTRYGSPLLKKVASFLSILTLCGILISQVVASKSIISSLGIQNEFIVIGFWLFIIAYTMVGGLKAVVITDIFQVLFIIAVFAGIFIYTLVTDPTSFSTLTNIFYIQKEQFIGSQFSSAQLIATLVMPALFSLIEQDLAQRFFAARTARIATLSAFFSSTFMFIFALIPIFLGMKAKLMGLTLAPGSSPLLPVISAITNEFVLIFALCAIIAAITSTADSLLCAISSNIAQDFDFSWTTIKNPLKRSQLITLFVGLFGLAASYTVPQDIIGILIESYAISVNCLLVPLLFAYFKKNVHKGAAIAAITCGIIGSIALPLLQTMWLKELIPLLLSFIGYMIGDMLSKRKVLNI